VTQEPNVTYASHRRANINGPRTVGDVHAMKTEANALTALQYAKAAVAVELGDGSAKFH
jgi:hypothetical protein